MFAYGFMIRYGPTLVDLTSKIIVLCTIVKVYLYMYNYSSWMELSMNIHEGNGLKNTLIMQILINKHFARRIAILILSINLNICLLLFVDLILYVPSTIFQ